MIRLASILKEGHLLYDHIVGTGGIGSGIIFSMTGNNTLGRNESRMAALMPFQDFCKLHIIMHYVSVLLGAGNKETFSSYPIGKVGNDTTGDILRKKMKKVGMDIVHVTHGYAHPTLFSICFQYPDFSGGNITTSNSASSQVLPQDILAFFKDYRQKRGNGIVLSVPEVPVATRIELLKQGKSRAMLNVASILSSEISEFKNLKGFIYTDILAVNIDEAMHIANIESEETDSSLIIDGCISELLESNIDIAVLITDGAKGVHVYQKGKMEFVPAIETNVVSTPGAGDAFLAGTISGICCGLPLLGHTEGQLRTAVDLGCLLASFAITSEDTINFNANAKSVFKYAVQKQLNLGADFKKIFLE